jgi:hypothetical protein
MQNLWLNSFIILVLSVLATCSHKIPKVQTTTHDSSADSLHSPYFQQGDSLYLFKTKVETYGKTIGGILILKSTAADTLRATFLSQVGLKFFDMEIYKDSFLVKDVIPQLNIKGVLKTLQDDIRQVVVWDKVRLTNRQDMTTLLGKPKMLRYDDAQDHIYFLTNVEQQILQSQKTILHTRKLKNEITYSNFNGSKAQHIVIKHYNFKLLIELEALK